MRFKTALAFLSILDGGPDTAANVGHETWGSARKRPQDYCRPAARVLARLRLLGLVSGPTLEGRRFVWRLTTKGKVELERMRGGRRDGTTNRDGAQARRPVAP